MENRKKTPILENTPDRADQYLWREQSSPWKRCSNGWAKHTGELRFNINCAILNACGAHKSGEIGEAHNPETHLIPLILQVPNGKREAISIFGTDYPTKDGTCVRDYI